MKIKINCLVFLIFFAGDFAFPQVNRLVDFRGGQLFVEAHLTHNLIAPTFSKETWENPALAASGRTPLINLIWIPPVQIELNQFYDVNRHLRSQVDQIVTRFREPGAPFEYPDLKLNLGVPGALQALGIIVPVKNITLSFDYRQMLDLRLNLFGSGHEATIQTETARKSFVFNSRNDLILNFELTGQQLQLGIARNLHEKWFCGVNFSGYFVQAFAEGHLNSQGSFFDGKRTYFFNDPEAGWENKFFQHLNANYHGSGIGVKIGGAFQAKPRWLIDFFVEFIPNFSLTGNLDLVQYKFSALNTAVLFENSSGNIIEPVKIYESQPTRTYAIENKIGRTITIRLPSQISLGSTLTRNSWLFKSRLSIYLREMTFHYLNTKAGVKPIAGLKFGFAFPYLTLETGVILAKEIREGLDKHIDKNRGKLTLPLPLLSLDSGFNLWQHYQIGGQISLLPTPGLKLRISVAL